MHACKYVYVHASIHTICLTHEHTNGVNVHSYTYFELQLCWFPPRVLYMVRLNVRMHAFLCKYAYTCTHVCVLAYVLAWTNMCVHTCIYVLAQASSYLHIFRFCKLVIDRLISLGGRDATNRITRSSSGCALKGLSVWLPFSCGSSKDSGLCLRCRLWYIVQTTHGNSCAQCAIVQSSFLLFLL